MEKNKNKTKQKETNKQTCTSTNVHTIRLKKKCWSGGMVLWGGGTKFHPPQFQLPEKYQTWSKLSPSDTRAQWWIIAFVIYFTQPHPYFENLCNYVPPQYFWQERILFTFASVPPQNHEISTNKTITDLLRYSTPVLNLLSLYVEIISC